MYRKGKLKVWYAQKSEKTWKLGLVSSRIHFATHISALPGDSSFMLKAIYHEISY